MDLALTFACGDYDRIRALKTNEIRPEGIDLRIIHVHPGDLFRRVAQFGEFDVAEMSVSTLTNLISRGDQRYIGIPVFPSRVFRHGFFIVNRNLGIEKPQDLRGKRVGMMEYQMTAALWQRAVLQHDYGVLPSEIEWVEGGVDHPGRLERNPVELPPDIKVTYVHDRSLSDLLERGEIAGTIGATNPSCFLRGVPHIQRLFPNYREAEIDYYRRTGFFPIMHMVAIKREIYERNRWVALNLMRAFVAAKRDAYARLRLYGALPYAIPWTMNELEETRQVMGEDFWKYGLPDNRATLKAMVTYSVEQGLSERPVDIEELFAVETHDEPGI